MEHKNRSSISYSYLLEYRAAFLFELRLASTKENEMSGVRIPISYYL